MQKLTKRYEKFIQKGCTKREFNNLLLAAKINLGEYYSKFESTLNDLLINKYDTDIEHIDVILN